MSAVTYAMAADAARARLGDDAFAHSVRVAQTAEVLALAYGVDPEPAMVAGVLHDWDREQSGDNLACSARGAGVALTPADEAVPYLLHARTGAIGAREALPGLSAEVLTAVSRHTYGAVDMSDLDMVVYLADTIEPARTHDGVDDLRAAVGTVELSELFARCYQSSVAHLVNTRRRIHPETVAVWNTLVARGER